MPQIAPLTLVQPNPSEQRRRSIANAMMGQALQYRPMRTGWEALGNVAQAYVGSKMGQQVDADYMARQEAARKTMADAMTAMNQPTTPTPYRTKMDAFYGTLATNPDTADLAAQMQLQGVMAQQEAQAQNQAPEYIKGYDPQSNQMQWYNPVDPTQPVFAAGPPIEQKKPEQLTAKDIAPVNKEITAAIKNATQIKASASKLQELADSGSTTDVIASAFIFMKSLDPTSTVRESEQGQVYSAEGKGAELAAYLNSLTGDPRLDKPALQKLVNTAKRLANSEIESTSVNVNSLLDVYTGTRLDEGGYLDRLRQRVPTGFEITLPAPAADAPIDDLLNFYK